MVDDNKASVEQQQKQKQQKQQQQQLNIILWRRGAIKFLLYWVLLPEASFGLWVLSLPAFVCVCVWVCGNHLLACAITSHPFKLEPPNLDQKSKTPWLRSLSFWGFIDLELQGQI